MLAHTGILLTCLILFMHLETFFFLFLITWFPLPGKSYFWRGSVVVWKSSGNYSNIVKVKLNDWPYFQWYTSNHKIPSQMKKLWTFSYRESGFLIKNYWESFLKIGESRLRALGKSIWCRHGFTYFAFLVSEGKVSESLKKPQIKASYPNFGGFQCLLDLEATIFWKPELLLCIWNSGAHRLVLMHISTIFY